MMINFTKMHGTGNDYVYINCFKEKIENPEQLARFVSDRHKGIGSDGLVLIMPSEIADFRMRMFNADGSEAEMCGNASRCVGKYVFDNHLTTKKEITLETKAGIKHLKLFSVNNKIEKVCVDMGEPVKNDSFIDQPVIIDAMQYHLTSVSMGNPHAVIFQQNIDDLPIENIGRKIENNPAFPNKTNVEFVEIQSRNHARMRVWERGAGETQACGTGACAVLVAGVLNNLLSRKATITLPGGDLEIEWNQKDNHVYMTGDAVHVFNGEFSIFNSKKLWL